MFALCFVNNCIPRSNQDACARTTAYFIDWGIGAILLVGGIFAAYKIMISVPLPLAHGAVGAGIVYTAVMLMRSPCIDRVSWGYR